MDLQGWRERPVRDQELLFRPREFVGLRRAKELPHRHTEKARHVPQIINRELRRFRARLQEVRNP